LSEALKIPLGAMMIQVTQRECTDPESRQLVEVTDQLILKTDALVEKLRAKLNSEQRG